MPIPLKMTVYKGSELVAEHAFDRDIVKIGRLASAHLKLDDTKVSRIHAVIEATSDGQDYSVIDMGSTEGTILNGQRISKEKLRDGDEIRLGDSRIVIQFVKTAAVSTSRAAPPPAPEPSGDVAWAPTPAEMATAEPTQSLAPVSPLSQQPQMQMIPQMMQPQMMQAADGSAVYATPYGYVPVGTMPPGMMSGMPQTMPPMGYAQQPMMPQAYPGQQEVPQMSGIPMGAYAQQNPFGAVANNLASDNVPETERALEIKTIWGNSIIDTISATTKPQITMGDERKVVGFGPFQQAIHCDIEVPSKGLPSKTYVIAEHQGGEGTNYTIHLPAGATGHIERADGTMLGLDQLFGGGHGAEQGDYKGSAKYRLRPAETLYLTVDTITLQIRYIRTSRLVPPGFMAEMNYTWVNILVLAFFLHAMAIVSFVATPHTSSELTEDIFKNPNRFAKYLLTPEQKQKQTSLLSKLKAGESGAKAKGTEGKAGRKDYNEKKQGRMAVKGDPNQEEIAKSTLTALFGKGTAGRSYLFGNGGLGGELKGALGGVTGAEVGDASGLGGLGTRGNGPGGGGLSMNSVGLGALGTAGRGSGGTGGDGYGEGASGLGKKADRDINISAGSPVIMGSLDKEIIRRIIKQHIAQIRYCYEKELVRSPGLFGKVATSFTISGDGHVQSASVTESTLKNDEVERCITAKIRTWEFPKPKGGGIVVVKYPFIFKTTG